MLTAFVVKQFSPNVCGDSEDCTVNLDNEYLQDREGIRSETCCEVLSGMTLMLKLVSDGVHVSLTKN